MKTFIFLCCIFAVLINIKISIAKQTTNVKKEPTTKKNGTSSSNSITSSTAKPSQLTTSTTNRPTSGLRLLCACAEGECGCCSGPILDQFNQKACVNVTYDPDDFALTAQMTMNRRVLFRRTVSGKNPPPMCVRLPRFDFIRFCVEFSNIYFASRNVHLCIDMEANWQDITLVEWSFDCIRMGASGVAVVGPEDGGGVPAKPIDSVDQTDEDYDDSARNVPLVLADRRRYGSLIFDPSLQNVDVNNFNKKFVRVEKYENGDIRIGYKRHGNATIIS